MTGFINKVFPEHHYGFATAADGRQIFIHESNCDPALDFDGTLEQRDVTFDVEPTERGWQGINVKAARP